MQVIATAHPQGGATWVFEKPDEQVDLETRYNTLVKVQGETIDHLPKVLRCLARMGASPFEPCLPRALGQYEEQAKPGTHIKAVELPARWNMTSRMAGACLVRC